MTDYNVLIHNLLKAFSEAFPQARAHKWYDFADAIGLKIVSYTVTVPMGDIPYKLV